ncbi:bombyxin A-1 homolog [Bombyx mandarina]|uniref:Bombyxin A-1 homolog n=1 Tax=Bombyx mandarina TaxID=7092 RepID=A0A6J2J9I0_BOMMA|nr:bombyxin A-1 homolog [Bombyx mandarina]
MRLRCYIYIMLILMRSSTIVFGDNAERVYSLDDKVKCCSRWLSTIIFNFCNNAYKIVKREKMAPKDLQQDTTKQRHLVEGKWRRVRRQVANECCLRSCTVAELIRYCPKDAPLVQKHPELFVSRDVKVNSSSTMTNLN